VILSSDFARVYGVPHKALNQAVRRNAARFPPDFVFRLSLREARAVAALRSQSVTLDTADEDRLNALPPAADEDFRARSRSQSVTLKRGYNVKYAPLAFTEHGALMAASVLNSSRAVQMSVFVMRAFLRLRQLMARQGKLAVRLARLERRVGAHDEELKAIVSALRGLLGPPPDPPRRRIGFATTGP
jgi:hypothetical protein